MSRIKTTPDFGGIRGECKWDLVDDEGYPVILFETPNGAEYQICAFRQNAVTGRIEMVVYGGGSDSVLGLALRPSGALEVE